MELNELSEAQLDLVYFAMNQAVASAKSHGTELPFTVADRQDGRELTWLENPANGKELANGDRIVVVQHTVLPSSEGADGIPAILVELSDGETSVSVAQPYRPGGPHRRFATLGELFQLQLQPA